VSISVDIELQLRYRRPGRLLWRQGEALLPESGGLFQLPPHEAIRRAEIYEYRLYGYKKFGHLDVTADVIDIAYVSAINGVKGRLCRVAGRQYNLTEVWKLRGHRVRA